MAAAAIVLSAISPAIADKTEEYTVVSGLPAGHPAVRIFREHFRAAVERHMAAAEPGLTLKWNPAYDGTIAKYGDVLEAVSDGIGDFGLISVTSDSRQLPLQDIFLACRRPPPLKIR